MLNEKQQTTELKGLTAADAAICLQIISRLVSSGNIHDAELAAVGTARNNLVTALEGGTGVNFDRARLAQQRALKEAQDKARQEQAAQVEATQEGSVTVEKPNTEGVTAPPSQDVVEPVSPSGESLVA